MSVRETTVDARTADGPMAVVITEPQVAPDDGTKTVVLFIDAPGLRPATRDFMHRMSGEGYRVITPDLHHRHGRLLYFEPSDMAENPEHRNTIWGWIESMTDNQIQHDMHCALIAAQVPSDEKFAVIGFCLGARAVVRSMQRHPDRVVAGAGWHPSFLADDKLDSPHTTARWLTQPLYLGIGEADEVQSIDMHKPFLDTVDPIDHIDVTTYPGADHGFTWPGYPSYHEIAAETSWTKTLAMFATAFG